MNGNDLPTSSAQAMALPTSGAPKVWMAGIPRISFGHGKIPQRKRAGTPALWADGLPSAHRDGTLRLLAALLAAETVTSMAFALAGVTGPDKSHHLDSLRGWLGLSSFMLLVAVLLRSGHLVRRLRQLLTLAMTSSSPSPPPRTTGFGSQRQSSSLRIAVRQRPHYSAVSPRM